MIRHDDIENNEQGKRELHQLIRQKRILSGGNLRLKIYGTLQCASGKRMLRGNRVFFSSEEEAISNGFRPCGNCMKVKYRQWKNKTK